ncbi:MAG: TRAP transporter small permease [Proteobacteria bacterium]|nr:TRAP transporter small permease [Pseudomonadota bacterium]MCA0425507.1 TRAP transporter small permease [Pseudomonadota bacterium]
MLRILDRLEEIIIATLIALATIVIFVAVVHRYGITMAIDLAKWGKANGQQWLFDGGRSVFNFLRGFNLTWAQELCIYLFVWMAKFGAAYGARTGIHVGVDVAVKSLNLASQRVVILFALAAGALFTFIVGSLGARFVWHIGHTDQVSPDLEMPMWLVYLAVPLGSYLMCFRFLQVASNYLRTGELPQHDHSHVDGLDEVQDALPGTLSEERLKGVSP